MKYITYFSLFIFVACSPNSNKEIEGFHESATEDTNQTTIVENIDSTFQFRKIGLWEFSGIANAELDSINIVLFPHGKISSDTNFFNVTLQQVDTLSKLKIGQIYLKNLKFNNGINIPNLETLTNFYYSAYKENGCVLNGYYLADNSISEQSFVRVNYIDKLNKVIYAEFVLYLKHGNASSQLYPNLPRNLVFKKGNFKMKLYQ